jgi:FkbM family methyltransferase
MNDIVYEKLTNFQWGPIHGEMKKLITKEFFSDKKNVYEKYNEVKENDTVVDLGSSIGPFGYQIKNRNIKKLYCVEPSLEEIDTLKKNLDGIDYTIINSAIGNNDNEIVTEVYGEKNEFKKVPSKTFKTFIKENNIDKIDFLKTDCEGGEYDVFNIENICWLKNNLRYCAGEFHLSNREQKEKFREFRDVYLRVFKNHRVEAVCGTDIKWDLWNENFINYYNQVIIYINNN